MFADRNGHALEPFRLLDGEHRLAFESSSQQPFTASETVALPRCAFDALWTNHERLRKKLLPENEMMQGTAQDECLGVFWLDTIRIIGRRVPVVGGRIIEDRA